MKKLSTVLIIFLMLQTFTACSGESTMSSNSNNQMQTESSHPVTSSSPNYINKTVLDGDSSRSTDYWQADRTATEVLLSKAENKKSLDEMLHTSYPENKIVRDFLNFGFNPNGSSWLALIDLNKRYSVDCLRKTTDNCLYCVYKTKEGGRLYLFFFSFSSNWAYNYSLYSKKALHYADFSALKPGDSLSAVERIDPACSLYRPVYPLKQINTRHLLKDGILNIDYSRNSAGNYLITRITYSKDFQFKGSRVDKSGNRLTENCTILPQDYIH